MVASGFLLHGDLAHVATVAVAGTNVAAANWLDGGDTIVSRPIGPGQSDVLPVLYDIELGIYDTVAAQVVSRSELRLRPNTWTATETITRPADMASLIGTDSASTSGNTQRLPNNPRELFVRPRYVTHKRNPLPLSLSWVSAGNSQMFATTANEDFVWIMQQAFPSPRGEDVVMSADGRPRVDTSVTRKAGATFSAARTWTQMINEVLSDDVPGLDPTKYYYLVGIGIESDATTDISTGVRFQAKGWGWWQVGLGGGVGTDSLTTWFTRGVSRFPGNTTVLVQGEGTGTTDTPNLNMYFQEASETGAINQQIGAPVTGGAGMGGAREAVQRLQRSGFGFRGELNRIPPLLARAVA